MVRARQLFSLCASFVLLASGVTLAAGQAQADPVCPTSVAPAGGLISSAEELQGLHDDSALWDQDWALTADVDMGGCTWSDHGIGDGTTVFSGVFDGEGHTISGLTVAVADYYVGLFGYVEGSSAADPAIIRNLTFTGDVSGDSYVGGLIGNLQNLGEVRNVHTTGDVTAAYDVAGGLIGYIRGYDRSIIDGSSATGDVLVVGGPTAGGLIGEANYATVTDSYATGSATATGDAYAGGLIATANSVTVDRSFATGNVSADAEAAGFIGYLSYGEVTDSYSLGDVTYTRSYIGYGGVAGFVGYMYESSVDNSYSIGSVTGDPRVYENGGFVANLDGTNTITDSFWDTETSGWDTSAAGIGLTTAEMADIATYSAWSISASFDAASTWGICPTVNSGYPFLTVFHASDPCSATQGRRTTAPRPVFQALPLPESGSCTDVDDSSFSFGSGVFGGWSRSWQPWVRTTGVDDATGGWACVRVLEYSLNADSWQVQAG